MCLRVTVPREVFPAPPGGVRPTLTSRPMRPQGGSLRGPPAPPHGALTLPSCGNARLRCRKRAWEDAFLVAAAPSVSLLTGERSLFAPWVGSQTSKTNTCGRSQPPARPRFPSAPRLPAALINTDALIPTSAKPRTLMRSEDHAHAWPVALHKNLMENRKRMILLFSPSKRSSCAPSATIVRPADVEWGSGLSSEIEPRLVFYRLFVQRPRQEPGHPSLFGDRVSW